ncbi:MAG: serine/threonine-protein kinase [bacterium]
MKVDLTSKRLGIKSWVRTPFRKLDFEARKNRAWETAAWMVKYMAGLPFALGMGLAYAWLGEGVRELGDFLVLGGAAGTPAGIVGFWRMMAAERNREKIINQVMSCEVSALREKINQLEEETKKLSSKLWQVQGTNTGKLQVKATKLTDKIRTREEEIYKLKVQIAKIKLAEARKNGLEPKFIFLGLLGSGGMAHAAEVYDIDQQAIVAIKVISPHCVDERKIKIRFKREAEGQIRLTHPHIVAAYEFGSLRPDDIELYDQITGEPYPLKDKSQVLYFTMEAVRSPNLDRVLLEERTLSWQRALDIGIQLADALDYMHTSEEGGVVHRDIKPENIFIDIDDQSKLADLGLIAELANGKHEAEMLHTQFVAAFGKAGGRLTEAMTVQGTTPYLAPEQCSANVKDERKVDIYQLAAVLYELVTGVPPHGKYSGQPIDYMRSIMTTEISSKSFEEKSNPLFAAVILKALSKDPDERHATMGDFLKDLKNVQNLSLEPE